MATIWAENIVGLYNLDGSVAEANRVHPVGTTWEIKKSHITGMRTAIEGLFVVKFGSIPSGWSAFDAYQLAQGKRRFIAWTNNGWDRYYVSHIDDIRQIVNYLEVYLSYTPTSFPAIVPLYDNTGAVISGNIATFSKVLASHIVSLRGRINVLEGLAYTYLDYSLCYDSNYVNLVDVPYMKSTMAEVDSANNIIRTILAPSVAMHEFVHIGRNATRFYYYDDNIGPDYRTNGYIRNVGSTRNNWTKNGIILSLARNSLFDDPYIISSRLMCPANNVFTDGPYEDCYIKVTGYGVGIRIFANMVGRTITPDLPALPYAYCQYKSSVIYDDNALYTSGKAGWVDYYGAANLSSPSVFVSDNGESITNTFNGNNAVFPLSGLWLTNAGTGIRYREIKLFDSNTDFTVLLRDGLPSTYSSAPRYCRLGVIMRAA